MSFKRDIIFNLCLAVEHGMEINHCQTSNNDIFCAWKWRKQTRKENWLSVLINTVENCLSKNMLCVRTCELQLFKTKGGKCRTGTPRMHFYLMFGAVRWSPPLPPPSWNNQLAASLEPWQVLRVGDQLWAHDTELIPLKTLHDSLYGPLDHLEPSALVLLPTHLHPLHSLDPGPPWISLPTLNPSQRTAIHPTSHSAYPLRGHFILLNFQPWDC